MQMLYDDADDTNDDEDSSSYRLHVNRVDSKDGSSDNRFRLIVTWRHLSTRQHEEHCDGGVQRNIDDVVSVRRQTTNVVVHSVETHNVVITVHTSTMSQQTGKSGSRQKETYLQT